MLIWLDWNWNVFVLKNMCKSFLHPDKDPLFQNVSRCFQEKNRQKICFDFSWMSHGNLKSHLVKKCTFPKTFHRKTIVLFWNRIPYYKIDSIQSNPIFCSNKPIKSNVPVWPEVIKVNWAQVSKQRCLGFSNQMTSLNSQTFGLPFVKPIKMFRSRSAIFLKTLHIFQRDMMIGTKGHGDYNWVIKGNTIQIPMKDMQKKCF